MIAVVVHVQSIIRGTLNIWDVRYLSPEFNNDGTSEGNLCDIYSLGCILNFLLTGSHPDDLPETKNAPSSVLTEAAAKKTEIPRPVLSLMNALMEKDPAKRMSSYHEVIKKMDGILNSMNPERRVFEFRKKFNIWASYDTNEPRRAELSGFSAGRAEKEIHYREKTDERVVKTAVSKVFVAKKITPFNKNWKKYDDSSSTWGFAVSIVIIAIAIAIAFLFAVWVNR